MMKAVARLRLLLAVLPSVSACTRSKAQEVVVYTSVDQVFSEPVFRDFEKRSGVLVQAVYDTEETKSTGVSNRLIAEAQHPRADVFWSGDPVRPFLLAKRGLVERYVSSIAARIPGAFKATDGTWTGFAARARVLLINRTKVGTERAPRSIRDLADPRWRGQAAMANPVFGTTTMHVAALVTVWGEERTRTFLNSLKANDVRIASSNGEVRRLVVSSEVAFGLTDTDDAFEAQSAGALVDVVYPDQDDLGALVMPTSVVVIKGGPHPEQARRLVDFLLSAATEEKLALAGAHMPLGAEVHTPPALRTVQQIKPMSVDYARVAAAIEQIQPWLASWAGL